MGLCFSKKKPPAKPGKIAVAVSDDKAKKPAPQPKRAAAGEAKAATANKAAAVFVVRPGSSSAKDAAAAAAPGEDPKKKRSSGSSQEPQPAPKQLPVVLVPSTPVRSSSCTKEEVDAILIQCGRLSRSSSGAGRPASSSGETGAGGGHRRRRSGSKRSYDFDQEARDEECDWDRQGAAAVSRPSPHRGSPQRKRSGSRERSGTGSGSRRASRSPGRRADGAATSVATAGSGGGDRARQQQPEKMVSVPAREKARTSSAVAASWKRCTSPRSSSPARMAASGNENAGAAGLTPVLSRSSSRKNEQSPYRRNPMAELDENSLRNNSNHSAKPQKVKIRQSLNFTPVINAILPYHSLKQTFAVNSEIH